jgi:hypothetical protein
MKTLTKILQVFFISMFMVGCLPDSISKFEEDTAEDTSTSTSTDTETEDDDAVEATPAPATPTPPTTIAYPDDDLPIHMEINETTLSLEPSIVIPDDQFLNLMSFAISPDLPNGLSINPTTGVISGVPTVFSALTTYTITSTFSADSSTLTDTIQISSTTGIDSVSYPYASSQVLVLEVTAPENFTAGGSFSTQPDGGGNSVVGTIRSVDTANSEISLLVTSASAVDVKVDDKIDNSSTFFNTEATVVSVNVAFDTGTLSGFVPSFVPAITSDETSSMAFSISPTLPAGMSLNTSTGEISGTPGSNSLPQTYIITARNLVGLPFDTTFKMSFISFPDPKTITSGFYPQSVGDRLIIPITDPTKYTVGGFVSNVDGAVARVDFIDVAGREIYVQITDNTDIFANADNLDNTDPFFAGEDLVSGEVIHSFPSDVDISTLTPTVSSDSGSLAGGETLTFSISPDITSATSLTYGSSDGEIDGTAPFADLVDTTFVVTVTNLVGRSFSFNYRMSISAAPADLAYTQDNILIVDSTDDFALGDFISSSSGGTGLVKSIKADSPNSPYIVVKVVNGTFSDDDDIDNLKDFVAQKATIISSLQSSTTITVSDASGFDVDDDITLPGLGRVTHVDDTNDIVYINVASGTFQDGDTLTESGGNSETILTLTSNSMILGTDNGAAFGLGGNVSGDVGTTDNQGIGIVQQISSNNLSVSLIEGFFNATDVLGDTNPSNATLVAQTTANLSDVTHDPTFYLYRGEETRIQADIFAGEQDLTYSVSPDLPDGLTLDTATGNITGTPTGVTSIDTYTITASNPFGSTTHDIDILVHDYVILLNNLADSKGILHKAGKGNGREPCRITLDQINGSDITVKDIHCIYDVGEAELFQDGLKLKMDVGDGVCSLIEHIPYHFYQFKAETSTTALSIEENTGDFNSAICSQGVSGVCQDQFGTVIGAGDFSGTVDPDDPATGDLAGTADEVDKELECLHQSFLDDDNTYTWLADASPATIEQFPSSTVAGTCAGDTTASGGANCDEGVIDSNQIEFDLRGICVVDGVTSTKTQLQCENEYGSCSGGTEDALDSMPASGDSVTNSTCTAGGGTWDIGGANFAASDIFIDNKCVKGVRVASVNTISCGGSQLNCINGAGTDLLTQTELDNDESDIRSASPISGLQWNFSSPEDKSLLTNIYLANFTDQNACTEANDLEFDIDNWTDENQVTLPTDPLSPLTGTEPFYTYHCVNGSDTVIARIRLQVREWDQDFRASDNIDEIDPGSLMDGSGNDAFGDPVNSKNDLDDINTGDNATACGTSNTSRHSFPGTGL